MSETQLIEGWNPDLPAGRRTSDFERVEAMLRSLSAQHETHVMAFDGEPHSKGRPRFGKNGHAYTPNRTRSAESALAQRFLALPTFISNVGVACIFYRSTRQRIDVDNLLKLTLDAATAGRMWRDDSQVTGLVGVVEYDQLFPRTVIAFGSHESTMLRGASLEEVRDCPTCDTTFTTTKGQVFCSRSCAARGRGAVYGDRACSVCGSTFTPDKPNERSCSPVCALALQRARQRRVDARRAPRDRKR